MGSSLENSFSQFWSEQEATQNIIVNIQDHLEFLFLKEEPYAHQGCIYLIKYRKNCFIF